MHPPSPSRSVQAIFIRPWASLYSHSLFFSQLRATSCRAYVHKAGRSRVPKCTGEFLLAKIRQSENQEVSLFHPPGLRLLKKRSGLALEDSSLKSHLLISLPLFLC